MSKLDDDVKKSRCALERIDKEYSADIAKLKDKKADADEIGMAEASWSSDRQIAEYELDSLLTRNLLLQAEKYDVPLPPRPIYKKDDTDWDHNDHWYHNPMNGSFCLTQVGRDFVDDAIWKKEERQHHRWSRWVTLTIGLIGTLTGLVSVTASNWEKFAAMFSSIAAHIRH